MDVEKKIDETAQIFVYANLYGQSHFEEEHQDALMELIVELMTSIPEDKVPYVKEKIEYYKKNPSKITVV